MNKIDLIQALKDSNHLSKSEAETVINLFFDKMADALAQGDRVEIRGLCSFFIKKYKGYTGRNPKTGEKVKVARKKLPFFQGGQGIEGTGGWLTLENGFTCWDQESTNNELIETRNYSKIRGRINARPTQKLSCGNRNTNSMG